MPRLSIPAILARKNAAEPLVALTAYTAPFASVLDAHVDILLVGDSLGMVLYGLDSTLAVPLEWMIAHGAAVVRGSERAVVIVDMPFGTYQASPQQAFEHCARVMKETGCSGVKLEGGEEMADTIRFLTERGIPVMAHVGLMPQHVHTLGGYRYRGRDDAERDAILRHARAVADAGAFSLVLEGMAEPVAREVTEAIAIPTIGIGASPACDGQILVTEDMAGLSTGRLPTFVRQFGALAEELNTAARNYATAVRTQTFPGEEECYGGEGMQAVRGSEKQPQA